MSVILSPCGHRQISGCTEGKSADIHTFSSSSLTFRIIRVTVILYLLFPVEASSVTVGYIDVTVRLEDCQLETPQDTIEQLAARCLEKTATQTVTSSITRGKDSEPVFTQRACSGELLSGSQVTVLAEILSDHNTCRCEAQRISHSDAASEPQKPRIRIFTPITYCRALYNHIVTQ